MLEALLEIGLILHNAIMETWLESRDLQKETGRFLHFFHVEMQCFRTSELFIMF